MKRSSCLDREFSRFLEIICEVPFQMMKLLILNSWRLSAKFSEFACWISGHGESPWQELFFDGNKSYQTLPLKKNWVSPCFKTNQSQPSLVALNVFGTQLLLVGVMILSIRDSWCWYHQDLNTNCSSFQFIFLKFAVSRNSSLKWCYGSLVFHFLRISLFWINEKVFSRGHEVFAFFGDNLWGDVSDDEASDTRLRKTFHQYFWIWLLKLSPRRKSLARTVFWWEQVISNLASQETLGVALRQNQPISAFFDGSQGFWYAVAVGRSDDFVHPWFLMLVPPKSEHKLQLISVSFPKICCLAELQFEMMFWMVGFPLLEDFVVSNQREGLFAWTRSFRVFWK